MIDTKKLLFLAFSAVFFIPAARAASLPLQWQAVASSNLRGYRVYVGTSSRNYSSSIDVGNTTQYTLTGLANCTRYYAAVKAYNQSGILSTSYSNEIVGMPTPQVTLVSPSAAEPGQALTINVTGSNFDTGATIVLPGLINVLYTQTQSCSLLTAMVSLSGSMSPGTTSAQVRNPDLSRGVLTSGFTITPTSVPFLRAVSPAPGGTNVIPSVRPSILFSERMMQSSINTSTVRVLRTDGSVVTQAAGSPTLDTTGTIAVIVPAAPLVSGAQYRVNLVGGGYFGVRDAQGTPIAASYTQSPAFQIVAAQTGQGTNLDNGTSGTYASVQASDDPVVEFRAAMDPGSLTPETVSLIGPDGAVEQTRGSPSLDETGMKATITPREALQPGAVYRVRVMGGPRGVYNALGQALASSFETDGFLIAAHPGTGGHDTDVPDPDGLWPIGIDPIDRTGDVPALVRPAVTFNRPLDPLSLSPLTIRLIDSKGSDVPQSPGSPILEATRTIVTIVPARPLLPGVAYRIEVAGGADGVRDADGETMKGTFDQAHGFAVEALGITRPEVLSTTPADGARKIDLAAHPTVTFTEPLDPGSVDTTSIELLDASGHAVAQAEGSPFLDESGTVVTIVPAEPLRGRAYYRIRVVAGPGGVRDFDGRSMAPASVSQSQFRTRAGARTRVRAPRGDSGSNPTTPLP